MAVETPLQFCSTPTCLRRAAEMSFPGLPLCLDCFEAALTKQPVRESPLTIRARSPQHQAAADVLQDVLETVWREQVVPHLVDAIFGPAPAPVAGRTCLPIPGAATPALPTRTLTALEARPCSEYACSAPATLTATKDDGTRLPFCQGCFLKKMLDEPLSKVRWLNRRETKED